MQKLPISRTADLLEQETGDELMIYDLRISKAFNLNATSKIVFKACDGQTSFDDLKRQSEMTDDLIYLTLDELKKNNLLEDDYVSPFAGMNRREVIKKVGLATMIALPIVSSLIAPSAANATSGAAAPNTIINFRTPAGTPQTSQQCNNAIAAGSSRCASNQIQPWNNNGNDNARNCEGRCI